MSRNNDRNRNNNDRDRGNNGGGNNGGGNRAQERGREGGNAGREDKPWKKNSVVLPGTSGQRLWLNKDGGVAGPNSDIRDDWRFHEYGVPSTRNRQATAKSAQKINDFLEKTGGTLKGGNGRPIIGYKAVNLERSTFGGFPWMSAPGNAQADGELPGGKEYIAIYAGKVKKDKDKGDRNRNRGGNEGGGESWTPSSNDLTGGASETGVDSTVEVPEVQDWGVDDQIAEQQALEAARRAAQAAAFENVLQATANTNYSPAVTYSPTNAVNPNPSAWENVLSTWDV